MIIKHYFWRAVVLSLVMVTTIACLSLTPLQKALVPTSTPTQTQAVRLNIGGGGGSGSGGNGGGGGGSGSGGSGGSGGVNNGGTPAPTPNPTPGATGPYVVKQIESLGHETIAGNVCSVTQAFVVNATAPEVSFVFNFVPVDAVQGKWTYAYSIPKAGETHDAKGSYSLSPAGSDGTLLLTMTGSDHVMFKGYDGTPAVNYKFDLVPATGLNCPAIP